MAILLAVVVVLLLLLPLLLLLLWVSSSVSTLEEEDAVEEMVECTELSVELRSESLESRMLLARRKMSSAFDLATGEEASRVAFMMLVELCSGGVHSVITELVLPLHSRWLPPGSDAMECRGWVRSGCCCEVWSRFRMVRARRKASWLSFSSAASGVESRALQPPLPPDFFGERRLKNKQVSSKLREYIRDYNKGDSFRNNFL